MHQHSLLLRTGLQQPTYKVRRFASLCEGRVSTCLIRTLCRKVSSRYVWCAISSQNKQQHCLYARCMFGCIKLINSRFQIDIEFQLTVQHICLYVHVQHSQVSCKVLQVQAWKYFVSQVRQFCSAALIVSSTWHAGSDWCCWKRIWLVRLARKLVSIKKVLSINLVDIQVVPQMWAPLKPLCFDVWST